ncbi:unnamed protein product [Amoebophrya sp. A120]|nr:unnamed protein product [Amoebophrya sp. A120]|eukprot:GSA120T00021889001.1
MPFDSFSYPRRPRLVFVLRFFSVVLFADPARQNGNFCSASHQDHEDHDHDDVVPHRRGLGSYTSTARVGTRSSTTATSAAMEVTTPGGEMMEGGASAASSPMMVDERQDTALSSKRSKSPDRTTRPAQEQSADKSVKDAQGSTLRTTSARSLMHPAVKIAGQTQARLSGWEESLSEQEGPNAEMTITEVAQRRLQGAGPPLLSEKDTDFAHKLQSRRSSSSPTARTSRSTTGVMDERQKSSPSTGRALLAGDSPAGAVPQPRLRLHSYTIGTRMNPLLFYLQHSAEVHNLPILPRGMGDPVLQKWSRKALQQKLVYHQDEAYRMKGTGSVLFFADAYDALLEAGEPELLSRFKQLQEKSNGQCRIFFSGEENCGSACIPGYLGAFTTSAVRGPLVSSSSGTSADGAVAALSANTTSNRFSQFLCSGGFIGEAEAFVELFRKYPIKEFAKNYPNQSEQYYWALVWGKEFEEKKNKSFFCLDDLGMIFASNLGYLKIEVKNQQVLQDEKFDPAVEPFQENPGLVIDFAKSPGSRVFSPATGTNPVVLHWNGYWKTNLYKTYVELTRSGYWKTSSSQEYNAQFESVSSSPKPGTTRTRRMLPSPPGEREGREEDEAALEEQHPQHLLSEGGRKIKAVPPSDADELSFEQQSVAPGRRHNEVADDEDQKPMTHLRALEAYAQISSSGGKTSKTEGFADGAARTRASAVPVSMQEFTKSTVFQDWDADAPSFFFLGGRLSMAMAKPGQIAYISFLLLLLVRLVFFVQIQLWKRRNNGRNLRKQKTLPGGGTASAISQRGTIPDEDWNAVNLDQVEDDTERIIGAAATSSVDPDVLTGGSTTVELALSGAENDDLPAGSRANKAGTSGINGGPDLPSSSTGTSTLDVQERTTALRSSNGNTIISLQTFLRHHKFWSEKAVNRLRIGLLVCFTVFCVFQLYFLYQLSCNVSLPMSKFTSVAKTVLKYTPSGGYYFLGFWLDQMPICFLLLGSAVIAESFCNWLKRNEMGW